MKKTIRIFAFLAVAAIGLSTSGFAQERSNHRDKRTRSHHSIRLNDDQKAMMKKSHEEHQAFRKSFEKTFNAKQRKIAADKSLKPMEKRKALESTFSSRQKRLIEKNREQVKKDRAAFMSSLSKEQRAAFERGRKQRHHRMSPDGKSRREMKKDNS